MGGSDLIKRASGDTQPSARQHACKFVFVGASYQFDHRIFRDFLLTKRFNGSTFTVVDLDSAQLKLVTGLMSRMAQQSGQDIRIDGTLDLDSAFHGADFVFPTFTIGGDATRDADARIAFKYGIVQPMADTIGPAGMSRALRKVPFAVDLAHRLHRDSPKGRIISFSSPVSVVTAAIARHSRVPVVLGLSHNTAGCRDFLAKLYNVPPQRLELICAGVNNLSWVLQVLIDGHDQTDQLDKVLSKAPDTRGRAADIETQSFALSLRVWRRYGFLPVSGDAHICEFFPQFTQKSAREAKRLKLKPFKAGKSREQMTKKLSKLAYGPAPIPMDQWSGESAHAVALAMLDNDNSRHMVNMPHDGALGAGIERGALVECAGAVGKKGVHGVDLGELPIFVKAMTQRLNAVHDLTVEAALEGNRMGVIQALLLDPSITDASIVPAMVDDYLKTHKRFLPRFWK